MINFIVGSAIVVSGVYLFAWARSAALRDSIEKPKHVFLQSARDFDHHTEQHE